MRFPDWLGTAASPLSRAGATVASSPSTGFGGSLLLEGRLEQADLALDRIAAIVLPERLSRLIVRSKRLQDEVRRLDATIHAPVPEARGNGNPLEHQLGILRAAFERGGT